MAGCLCYQSWSTGLNTAQSPQHHWARCLSPQPSHPSTSFCPGISLQTPLYHWSTPPPADAPSALSRGCALIQYPPPVYTSPPSSTEYITPRSGHVTTYHEPSHTPQLTTGILSLLTCSPNFLQLKSYNRSRPRRTIFSAAGTGSGPHQRFNNTMSSFIITYNNNQPPVF